MPLLFDNYFKYFCSHNCSVRKPETEVELSASHFASIFFAFRFARIENASRGTAIEIKYTQLRIYLGKST